MIKLSDLQSLLLATAASRDSGSLVPLPTTIKAPAAGVARSLASLTAKRFVEEREVSDATLTHRTDCDLRYGLFVTAAGKQAIGVKDDSGTEQGGATGSTADVPGADTPPAAKPASATKSAAVLALLGREEGATLAELVAATGWLPHTTRAAMTGLRKKGHAIAKAKRDGVTCYRVPAA